MRRRFVKGERKKVSYLEWELKLFFAPWQPRNFARFEFISPSRNEKTLQWLRFRRLDFSPEQEKHLKAEVIQETTTPEALFYICGEISSFFSLPPSAAGLKKIVCDTKNHNGENLFKPFSARSQKRTFLKKIFYFPFIALNLFFPKNMRFLKVKFDKSDFFTRFDWRFFLSPSG